MAGQDNYNHPSYLTRQQVAISNVVAGASGTSAHRAFISNMRLRAWNATTVVAGTATASNAVTAILQAIGANMLQYTSTGVTTSGTATTTINLGTAAYSVAAQQTTGAVSTVADQNVLLPAGTVLSVKNGADATAVTGVTLEMYLDPSATWTTGQGN